MLWQIQLTAFLPLSLSWIILDCGFLLLVRFPSLKK